MFRDFVRDHFTDEAVWGGGIQEKPRKNKWKKRMQGIKRTKQVLKDRLNMPAINKDEVQRRKLTRELLMGPDPGGPNSLLSSESLFAKPMLMKAVQAINKKFAGANVPLHLCIANSFHKYPDWQVETLLGPCSYEDSGQNTLYDTMLDRDSNADEAIVILMDTQLRKCVSSVIIHRPQGTEASLSTDILEIASRTADNEKGWERDEGDTRLRRGQKFSGKSLNTLLRHLAVGMVLGIGKSLQSMAVNSVSVYLLSPYIWEDYVFETPVINPRDITGLTTVEAANWLLKYFDGQMQINIAVSEENGKIANEQINKAMSKIILKYKTH